MERKPTDVAARGDSALQKAAHKNAARGDTEALPMDEVVDLLEDIDDPLLVEEEPDVTVLAQEEPELESLVKDEPLEILDNPSLVMELSEDPVRLYLKEIGGIDLLDTDREFWLASQPGHRAPHRRHQPRPPAGPQRRIAPAQHLPGPVRRAADRLERLEEDSQRLGYPRPELN
jgi:hypothetical protein